MYICSSFVIFQSHGNFSRQCSMICEQGLKRNRSQILIFVRHFLAYSTPPKCCASTSADVMLVGGKSRRFAKIFAINWWLTNHSMSHRIQFRVHSSTSRVPVSTYTCVLNHQCWARWTSGLRVQACCPKVTLLKLILVNCFVVWIN